MSTPPQKTNKQNKQLNLDKNKKKTKQKQIQNRKGKKHTCQSPIKLKEKTRIKKKLVIELTD